MTSIDEELRAALTLLEQRAPDLSPDSVLTLQTEHRRRRPQRRLAPVLAAAAMLVVVAAVAIVAATRQSGHRTPAADQSSSATRRAYPTATTCLETARPRPGLKTTLVPGSPTAVTICQYPGGHPSSWVTTDIGSLVAALNALPTRPTTPDDGCEAKYPGALPARGTYELHFHYATGPDVVVNVLPECRPSVDNSTSLAATDAASVVTVLQQLAPARLNVQYKMLAVSTGCMPMSCRSPGALASLVHATACATWQLNPETHGIPSYLVRLLVPSDMAAQDRSRIAGLPGVNSVAVLPGRGIAQTPHRKRNFPPPAPARCD